MYKSFLFLFIFLFYHWFYIGLGFLLYYVFHLYNIGHYLICVGLAPMFGYPKKLHNWVVEHCPFPSNNGICRRWSCPHYKKCEYSIDIK